MRKGCSMYSLDAMRIVVSNYPGYVGDDVFIDDVTCV